MRRGRISMDYDWSMGLPSPVGPPSIEVLGLTWVRRHALHPDWEEHDYAAKQSWGEDYKMAILGAGGTFHRPILSNVVGRVQSQKRFSHKWNILYDAGIEWHLHSDCQTGFWAPTWQLVEISMLRDLAPLNKVPYMACSKCGWPEKSAQALLEEWAVVDRALVRDE